MKKDKRSEYDGEDAFPFAEPYDAVQSLQDRIIQLDDENETKRERGVTLDELSRYLKSHIAEHKEKIWKRKDGTAQHVPIAEHEKKEELNLKLIKEGFDYYIERRNGINSKSSFLLVILACLLTATSLLVTSRELFISATKTQEITFITFAATTIALILADFILIIIILRPRVNPLTNIYKIDLPEDERRATNYYEHLHITRMHYLMWTIKVRKNLFVKYRIFGWVCSVSVASAIAFSITLAYALTLII